MPPSGSIHDDRAPNPPHDMSGYGEPPIERRGTGAEKWERYAGRDVLPFWVADMDLPTAPFVLDAVRERLQHPILGYTRAPPAVIAACVDWLARDYGWRIQADWLVWITGVVPGFNLVAQLLAEESAGGRHDLVMPTPVYPPFLEVPRKSGLRASLSNLRLAANGRWEMDFDDLAARIGAGTAAVLFCNPQNPTGRIYERGELVELADLIVANDTVLISDEIHCPLILDRNQRHLPIASLDESVAARSVSLFSPTKAYNFAGLGGAVAVIPNAALRKRFKAAVTNMAGNVSPLAYAALGSAFGDTSPWLAEQNAFLASNEVRLRQAIANLDGIRTTRVEGTFLAWLDVRELNLANPAEYFEAHGIGLSAGEDFGGVGFVRFNFGCPRSMLEEGIERLERAVRQLDRRS